MGNFKITFEFLSFFFLKFFLLYRGGGAGVESSPVFVPVLNVYPLYSCNTRIRTVSGDGGFQNACDIINERLEPYKKKQPTGSWAEWVKMAYFDKVNLCVSGFYA